MTLPDIGRDRHYGLLLGDVVEQQAFGSTLRGTVVEFVATDNNRAVIETDEGDRIDVIAEWCRIITPKKEL